MMKTYQNHAMTDAEARQALADACKQVETNLPLYTYQCQNHSSVNDIYPGCANNQWTCGFWPGEIWLAYEATGDEKFKTAALIQVDSFADRIARKVEVDHHDMGFLYSPTCVAAWKLVGSETGKNAAIAAADQLQTDKEIFTVDAFKEKPDKETAEKYLAEGNSFWNAGIFVWNVRTITSVMRVYAPGIAQIFDRIFPDFYTEKENETIKKLFPTCESISIDYAVMEKAQEIYVLPASFGWSDLGTWGALRGLLPQDKSGNATVGTDIRLYESKNCIVHASEEKRVVIQGLDGYIIAEKDNTLLICKLEEEQRIKEFSK